MIEGWYEKREAAEAIGVSMKTVEKLAQTKVLQQRMVKPPGRNHKLVVYHPDDVARERKERNPDAPPFVLPPAAENGSVALQRHAMSMPDAAKLGEDILRALLNGSQAPKAPRLAPSELRYRIFLSEDEAVAFTGLGKGTIRKLVKPLHRVGPLQSNVYRRTDLEKLSERL